MFKFSMFIIYAIIAFNITVFAVFLQLDLLIFNSVVAKLITWLLVAGFWIQAIRKRQVFVTLI